MSKIHTLKTSSKRNQAAPPKAKKKLRKKYKHVRKIIQQTPKMDKTPMSSVSKSTAPQERKPQELSVNGRKPQELSVNGECNANTFKPVCKINTPEDYSANWKMLKEILIKNSKKRPKPILEVLKHKKVKKQMEQPETNISKDNEIWFDDVDPILVEKSRHSLKQNKFEELGLNMLPKKLDKSILKAYILQKEASFTGSTRVVALDCEMVGGGYRGKENILARISIVNQWGNVLYDKFVKPIDHVVDYRTEVSGIRPSDLVNAESFSTVQKEVYDLIKGRILVGHALSNDMKCLLLSHPKSMIRDTSRYKPFRSLVGGLPSLKKLTNQILGIEIQSGEHSPVQDAQAAMRLYTLNRKEWEKNIRCTRGRSKKKGGGAC